MTMLANDARTGRYDQQVQDISRRIFFRALGTLGIAAATSTASTVGTVIARNRLDGGTPTSSGAALHPMTYDGGRP